MHLNDLGVVVCAKHRGGMPGEGEEQVHPDREIAGPDAGHLGREAEQALFLVSGMAGGANDDGLAVQRGQFQQPAGGLMVAEIDNHIAASNPGRRIVARVEGGGDDRIHAGGETGDGLAHAAFGTVEEDF